MDSFDVMLISAFFFIMGAAVIGFLWYFQRITKPKSSKNASTDPNLSELARLMRNLQTQELVVKMDGKTFNGASDLSPAQLRRLGLASTVLIKWLNQTSLEPQPKEAPLAELPALPPEPAEEESLSEPAMENPVESRVVYTPPFAAGSVEEVKPVSTQLPDMVTGYLTPPPKPTAEFPSIASQINDILQEQIAGTELDSRGITVNEGHDRGVMVTLDGKQYQGVMDVPDEEVRRAIRAAVVEWETRK